jgi:hypothetical protein
MQADSFSVHTPGAATFSLTTRTIRIGINKGLWQLAVYLPDRESPAERPVIGTRQDAEIAAHAIIDAWLKKRIREHLASAR